MLNWRDFRPLFMERSKIGEDDDQWDLSLGRLSFWAVFVPALYLWLFKGVDVFPGHLQMLYITITYNLAKKMPWMRNIIDSKIAPKEDKFGFDDADEVSVRARYRKTDQAPSRSKSHKGYDTTNKGDEDEAPKLRD